MLNEEQFRGKWNEIKGGIRTLWGRITDNELDETNGDFTEVSGLVEERYGETKAEIKQKLHQLMDSFDNDSDKNIIFNEASYQRSPVRERTSAESQLEDEAADYTTRSHERVSFEEKTYAAGEKELNDPQHNSNYAGANPGREKLGHNPNAFRPGRFDKTADEKTHH